MTGWEMALKSALRLMGVTPDKVEAVVDIAIKSQADVQAQIAEAVLRVHNIEQTLNLICSHLGIEREQKPLVIEHEEQRHELVS
jgi:hypothetical protein